MNLSIKLILARWRLKRRIRMMEKRTKVLKKIAAARATGSHPGILQWLRRKGNQVQQRHGFGATNGYY